MHLRWSMVLALVATLTIGSVGLAEASPRTFHGVWGPEEATWAGCTDVPDHPVTGIWTVTLRNDGHAVVNWNLWELGMHLVVAGASHGTSWDIVSVSDDGFVLDDGAGALLTLVGDRLTLHIEPWFCGDYAEGYGTLRK